MMKVNIERVCPKCNGEGVYNRTHDGGTISIDPCPMCNGAKIFIAGQIDVTDLASKIDDVMNKCNDIIDKCNDILEKFEE